MTDIVKFAIDKLNEIKNDKLRNLILNDPVLVRDLLLTSHMIDLVKTVAEKGEISTVELSKLHRITTQNASSKLNRLCNKGYLNREQVTSLSGGIEYIYSARFKPKKYINYLGEKYELT